MWSYLSYKFFCDLKSKFVLFSWIRHCISKVEVYASAGEKIYEVHIELNQSDNAHVPLCFPLCLPLCFSEMFLFNVVLWAFSPALCLAAVAGLTLSAEQLKHLKDDPKVTHIVSFDIASIDLKNKIEPIGTLELALFGEKAPITVANFVEKAQSQINGYQNSIFHRIVQDFVIQGGNLMRTSSGYKPIEFTVFDDEPFLLKHNKQGRLSMANSGPNTNGCQFFITTAKPTPHLDGIHVVFGQLVLGFEALDILNHVETLDSKPVNDITITRSVVSKLYQPASPKSGVEVVDTRASPGYRYLMILCVLVLGIYLTFWYKGRKTFVDITTFKM